MSQLMTLALFLLAFAAILGPLVALHEWGHYIVARLCGVKVLTYSIGLALSLPVGLAKKPVRIIEFLPYRLAVM